MRFVYLDIEGNDLYPQVSEVFVVVTRQGSTVPLVWTNESDYHLRAGTLKDLTEYLDDPEITVVAHNGYGYDFPVLVRDLKCTYLQQFPKLRTVDTLALARTIYPASSIMELDTSRWAQVLPKNLYGSHSLEAWGYRLGVHKTDFHDFSAFSTEMVDYCIDDVEVLLYLHQFLVKEAKQQEIPQTVLDLEQQVAYILAEQERNGVLVDPDAALRLDQTLRVEKSSLTRELQTTFPPTIEVMKTPDYYQATDGRRFTTIKAGLQAGYKRKQLTAGPMRTKEHQFNPGSRAQIASRLKALYDWDAPRTEKGNASIDDAVLEGLEYPEAVPLHRYMLLNKRLGQLSDGQAALRKYITDNNRIHGRVNPCGCRTYRMAHSSPNLGQIPAVRSDYGEEFRSLFTSGPGKVLVGIDAKGLEGRFKGHYLFPYDNGTFVQMILDDADLHTRNAEILDLTRDKAKTWYYAWLFGASPKRLAQITGRTVAEEEKYKNQFLAEWPELAQLLQDVQSSYDMLSGLDGRPLQNNSEHTALNTKIQSAGAILMKVALVLFYTYLLEAYPKHRWSFVLNVHDEWQLEVDEEIGDEVGLLGIKAIEQAGELLEVNCPMTGDYKVGKTWAETH